MSRFQCIPGHLAMGESVSRGQRWTYASAHPMSEMLEPRYFLAQRAMLRPGDTIRIIELRDKDLNASGNRVLAYVDMLVVESSGDTLTLRPEHDVVTVPTKDEAPAKPTAWSTERFIKSDGDVKWNNKAQVHEVFESGVVVAACKNKEEAWRIATGELPIPQPEDEAA